MKPAERREWILEHLRQRTSSAGPAWVDVLDRWFVDAYAEHTGARVDVMPFGANKCRTLGADLAALHREGKLHRRATGIEGLAGMGFPRWVYTYRLKA
jgi:hypothetical protein